MSVWIRAGDGQPWHRVSPLEFEAAATRRTIELTCGAVISADDPWEEWESYARNPDDQHPECGRRAVREEFWRAQWEPADTVDVVRRLVAKAAPDLDDVQVEPPDDEVPHVGWVVRLHSHKLDRPLAGAGHRVSVAIADLMATLEARSA